MLVQLSYHNGLLGITVEDDGIGFNAAEMSDGIGLQNIRTRVEALSGTIDIMSTEGTSVYLSFELQPAPITESCPST